MARTAAGAGALALSPLAGACLPEAPPRFPQKDLQLVGEPQVHPTTGKEVHVTGAVRNTGTVRHQATVRVRLLDATGTVIVTSHTYPFVDPGGETTYLVVVFPEGAAWTRADARIMEEVLAPAPPTPSAPAAPPR